MENDSRYPYTYACDYLRGLAGYGEGGTKLSRADASQMRSGIAEAIGMSDDELARKLADYYKANQDTLTKKSCEAFARSQAWPKPAMRGRPGFWPVQLDELVGLLNREE